MRLRNVTSIGVAKKPTCPAFGAVVTNVPKQYFRREVARVAYRVVVWNIPRLTLGGCRRELFDARTASQCRAVKVDRKRRK
jgi:hypothetical protein